MRRKDREVIEINEIESIIRQCKTCHVAMVDEGQPYVVPLSFGYEIIGASLTLYFHSAKVGRKIDILNKNSRVCFEMSNEGIPIHSEIPCNSGFYYSSIIGYGNIEFIEEVNEKCKALSLLMKHQADKEVLFNETQVKGVCVYKISTSDYTGKSKPMPNKNCGEI